MGLDLKLIPIDEIGSNFYSDTVLSVSRYTELFIDIRDLDYFEVTALKSPVSGYLSKNIDGESCYGEMSVDGYGSPLCFVMVGILVRVFEKKKKELSLQNLAVLAYLKCLPKKTRIILYWS